MDIVPKLTEETVLKSLRQEGAAKNIEFLARYGWGAVFLVEESRQHNLWEEGMGIIIPACTHVVFMRMRLIAQAILGAIGVVGISLPSHAFEIESSTDAKVRWDNTFKYNAGYRLRDPSNRLEHARRLDPHPCPGEVVTGPVR